MSAALTTSQIKTLLPSLAAQELQRRQKARANLLDFTSKTFPTYSAAAHHRVIAEALERVERGEIDRLMLQVPPRHGKSELASRRFPAFCLGRKPTRQFIAVSATAELAQEFGREVRNLMAAPEYQAVFSTALAEDSQARGRWHTTQGGIYYAVGIGGAVMGKGADILLIDDPFATMEDAQSELSRKRVWDWYTGTAYNRLMPGGAIVLINHRMHEDDLCGRLLAQQAAGGDRWEVVSLPAIAEGEDALGREVGEALWPSAYPIERLERIQRATPERYWTSLYQQRPSAAEGAIVKRHWWRPWREEPIPEADSLLYAFASLDPAYTDKDSNDPSACTVWFVYRDQHRQERILLRYAWEERLEFHELIEHVKDTLDNFGITRVLVEAKATGLSIIQELRRQRPELMVHSWRPIGDKVARLHAVTPLLKEGIVSAMQKQTDGEWDWRTSVGKVIDQCAQFPAAAHDDLVDTVSQALLWIRTQGLEFFEADKPPAPTHGGFEPRALY